MKSSIECKEQAIESITEFFHIYHAVEAKEEIRRLAGIIKKSPTRNQEYQEEDTIYFCEKLEELVEAAAFIAKFPANGDCDRSLTEKKGAV